MNSAPRSKALGNLVDVKGGLISREIFTSEELYQQQLERIFARAWLFVGMASQVPKPNDFFVSRMGEESVILTRDRQGELHVLLNTCMHRGMKVCRYDEGNTPVFSCPYHGWSYSTDGNLVSLPGELIGVPQFATAYHGELKKEEWGLVSVPKMVNHNGAIFASWDKDAPEFYDYMGDMIKFFDSVIDGADGEAGGVEVLSGVQKFIIPSSWMYGAENFIGDSYHNISHRSVDLVGISPQGEGRHTLRNDSLRVRCVSFPELGHGGLGGSHEDYPVEYIPTWPKDPAAEEYFRIAHERRQQRVKDGEDRWSIGVSTIFPNTSTHSDPRAIFVWHPAGPMKMEMWRWFFVEKNAPESVKDSMRHFALRYSGPAGMTEQDDTENWNYATAASAGTIAGRFKFNYEMGVGQERPGEELNGAVYLDQISELNQRTLYKRWAEFMDAESWDELFPKRTS